MSLEHVYRTLLRTYPVHLEISWICRLCFVHNCPCVCQSMDPRDHPISCRLLPSSPQRADTGSLVEGSKAHGSCSPYRLLSLLALARAGWLERLMRRILGPSCRLYSQSWRRGNLVKKQERRGRLAEQVPVQRQQRAHCPCMRVISSEHHLQKGVEGLTLRARKQWLSSLRLGQGSKQVGRWTGFLVSEWAIEWCDWSRLTAPTGVREALRTYASWTSRRELGVIEKRLRGICRLKREKAAFRQVEAPPSRWYLDAIAKNMAEYSWEDEI